MIDWERRRFNRSVEARLLYLVMFFTSTVALGCSYYRIFRVQEETTKSRGSVPKAAIFLVTAGMTLATVSISNNSGALGAGTRLITLMTLNSDLASLVILAVSQLS